MVALNGNDPRTDDGDGSCSKSPMRRTYCEKTSRTSASASGSSTSLGDDGAGRFDDRLGYLTRRLRRCSKRRQKRDDLLAIVFAQRPVASRNIGRLAAVPANRSVKRFSASRRAGTVPSPQHPTAAAYAIRAEVRPR